MKIGRIFFRVVLVLLGLVAAVLLVRAILNIAEGRRLMRLLEGLRVRGTPLSVLELVGTCPEGENGAMLWRAAEELWASDGKENRLLTEVDQNLREGIPINANAWTSISDLITKNRRVLDLVTEVAGMPCFQYGATNVHSFERRLPDALKMIRVVRLLGLESLLIAESGDMRGCLDRLRTGFRFAPKLAEESSLISYLIALANMKTCLLFLNRSLAGRDAGEELLLPLLGDLGPSQIERWKDLLQVAIRGERVLLLDVGLSSSDFEDWSTHHWLKGWLERRYLWLIRPLIKRDLNLNLPVYAELESKAFLPYDRTRDFWKLYKGRLDGLPWYAVASRLVQPEMEATFLKVASLDALVLTAGTGLACRIHKGRTGGYPGSLEELVPSLLSEVPIDPFTGKPLVYRREGEGFIVYSLGANLQDDAGRSTWIITQLVMDKDDDWTWKEDK